MKKLKGSLFNLFMHYDNIQKSHFPYFLKHFYCLRKTFFIFFDILKQTGLSKNSTGPPFYNFRNVFQKSLEVVLEKGPLNFKNSVFFKTFLLSPKDIFHFFFDILKQTGLSKSSTGPPFYNFRNVFQKSLEVVLEKGPLNFKNSVFFKTFLLSPKDIFHFFFDILKQTGLSKSSTGPPFYNFRNVFQKSLEVVLEKGPLNFKNLSTNPRRNPPL